LYTPDGHSEEHRVPNVVMAHGLGGVRGMRLDAFAERFCAAGYACLVFDYRYFGDSSGEPRELIDIKGQLADWRAAVAYARTLSGVDPERIIVWGTSFGGGHVIVTAAEDPRIAAAIAQCPFTDGLASAMVMNPQTSLKLAALAVRDVIATRLGRPPVRVALSAEPGQAGLMTAPDALPGYQALRRASGLEGPPHTVPARVAFDIPLHFPGRRASDVTCPILFTVCEKDSVAPAAAAVKYAQRALRSEVRLYNVGHFDIYVGEPFEAVVADQIDFLASHVPNQNSTVCPKFAS
jgi:pimeloyl-ACP methyl ester carboxylesterase